MVRKSFANLGCSVANTVEILSDSWTVLVLRDLFLGVRRFDEFVTSLGIARNTLSDRLNRLVESGLVSAEPYQERPVRYEYRLTEMGKDLFDVMMTLRAFGEKWTPAADPERQRAIHVGCGQEADAVTHCGHCGERLTRRNVQIVPGLQVVAARAD
jgi:DNA-binding HxlR family transcriptional regulator